MYIIEEYLENAMKGYPHLTLKILVFDHEGTTIVAPLLFYPDDKMLPYNIQHKAKGLLNKLIADGSFDKLDPPSDL